MTPGRLGTLPGGVPPCPVPLGPVTHFVVHGGCALYGKKVPPGMGVHPQGKVPLMEGSPPRKSPYGDIGVIKYKNGRIPSHKASQKLSIGSFGSKFNFKKSIFIIKNTKTAECRAARHEIKNF